MATEQRRPIQAVGTGTGRRVAGPEIFGLDSKVLLTGAPHGFALISPPSFGQRKRLIVVEIFADNDWCLWPALLEPDEEDLRTVIPTFYPAEVHVPLGGLRARVGDHDHRPLR